VGSILDLLTGNQAGSLRGGILDDILTAPGGAAQQLKGLFPTGEIVPPAVPPPIDFASDLARFFQLDPGQTSFDLPGAFPGPGPPIPPPLTQLTQGVTEQQLRDILAEQPPGQEIDFEPILTALAGMGGQLDDLRGLQGDISSTEAGGFLSTLQTALEGLINTDPLDAAALRADPQTAALLADLKDTKGRAEADVISRLNQFGVLRGGNPAALLGQLQGEFGRGELDILSGAASRAQERQLEGLGRGVEFGGLLSERELGIGELLGELGGKQTLGGREADLGLLASIISSLDPDLDINKNTLAALIDTIFSAMGGGGFDSEAIEALRYMIQGQGGTGFGLEEDLTTADGKITGGDMSGKWAAFRADNPDLANNSRIKVNYYTDRPGEARDMSTGQLVARYNEATGKWERT
jgi:hypothetical protein